MARYEIDTLLCFTLFIGIDPRATQEAVGDPADRTLFAAQKTSAIVSEPAIPLLPRIADKAADLIESCGIPCLRYELSACEIWIRFNVPKHRRRRETHS